MGVSNKKYQEDLLILGLSVGFGMLAFGCLTMYLVMRRRSQGQSPESQRLLPSS
jgi:hypothetical protein